MLKSNEETGELAEEGQAGLLAQPMNAACHIAREEYHV